jgi:16S rRNA (cytosine967-C5)-methyltransferase
MKYFSYLNSAIEITGLYKAQQPFHLFIKDFFRQHKKYGSSDRKQIIHLCYCWFRTGNAIKNAAVQEKMLASLFLCSHQHNEMLAHIKPEWNEKINLPFEKKCGFLNIPFHTRDIFPCPDAISAAIDTNDFILSHLIQPDVFLRIRPGHRQAVINKLEQEQVVFSSPAENCIGLPNATKMDGLINLNKEAVIQDYSSQRTGEFLELVKVAGAPIKIWDCCAASGGKSIMAKDILGKIDLTVSDIRKPVLINLKKRFEEAGIRNYKTLITDLAVPVTGLAPASFQLIIADVPCSGSGTWSRTPERLSFFNEKEIDTYCQLQKKIVTTVIPYLKPGGYFLYITCSVFKKENEEMASFIQNKSGMEPLQMKTLQGYSIKADTMFACMFRKPISPADIKR